MDKDPTSYSGLTYIWVSVVSIAGILVHFLQVNRTGLSKDKIRDLIIDLFIAPVLGIFTFYICESLHISQIATAGIIGLLSTFGTKGLYLFRRALLKKLFNMYIEDKHE